jgi:hypothetical protein
LKLDENMYNVIYPNHDCGPLPLDCSSKIGKSYQFWTKESTLGSKQTNKKHKHKLFFVVNVVDFICWFSVGALSQI